MKILIAVLALLVTFNAHAKGFAGDMGLAGEMVDLSTSDFIQKVEGILTPANKIQTGLKVRPSINVDGGVNYELIGVYSGVGVNGLNVAQHRDAIGVQGTVFKNSADANAVGLKCSVYDAIPGGTSTCLEVSFPYSQAGTPTNGISMQPSNFATDLVGISFAKNPQAYKYATDYAGAPVAMGSKAGSTYCIQFNDATAELDYIKNCGTASEEVVGQVAMASAPPAAIQFKGKKPRR